MLKLGVQTWPPLGQVTSTPLREDDLDLVAILQVPTPDARLDWKVSLWYAADGKMWQESILKPLDALDPCLQPHALDRVESSQTRLYFGNSIHFQESLRFTLRYTPSAQMDWTWVRDQLGLDDGMVIGQTLSPPSEKLQDYIRNLDPEWKVSSCLCQTPKTQLWMLEAAVPRPRLNRGESDSDRSTFKDIRIGLPKIKFLRWFALVRQSTAWLAPRHGKETFSVDKDAVLCAFLLENGRYLVFLGCGGINEVLTTLQSTPAEELSARARSDGSGSYSMDATVLVSESSDLGCAIAAVVYKTREMFRLSRKITMEYQAEEAPLYGNSKFHPEWYENWYDGLGYCTWNALGQDLTEQKLNAALDSLSKSGINISNLILDDNWQSLDRSGSNQFSHGWKRFDADPVSFPSGLKATIASIRAKHPRIQHVAVWHALLGYWGGISPTGELADKYKTVSLERKDSHLGLDDTMTVISDQDGNLETFYKDFYAFLSDCGIDSVKTDVQAMLDTWTSSKARRELLFSYLDSWSLAALKSFSMRAISCMSLFPHGIFYTQNNSIRPSFLVRTSDDFFPDEPESHTWHIWTNAHNCVMMQDLNVVPDWDMFQTKHDWGEYHAAARCISGGPIYITDKPGQHDLDLISKITGRTPRGKTVTLRPGTVAKAVDPFVGFHDMALLKVGSYHGASQTGISMLGVFNVSKCPITELVPLSAFPGVVNEQDYIVRAYSTGRVSVTRGDLSRNALFSLTLETRGYEIFSAYPLTIIHGLKTDKVEVATLGLLDKITGCAAIVSNSVGRQDNGRTMIDTRVKAFGILGIYLSSLPDLGIEADFMVTIQQKPIPRHCVKISDVSSMVLEIDIETAWEEMGLDSGWSNEVEVKINVGA